MDSQTTGFEQCEASLSDTGLIQDTGALCWISRRDGRILHASNNFPDHVGIAPPVGRTAADLFGVELSTRLLDLAAETAVDEIWNSQRLYGRAEHDGVLIEFERQSASSRPCNITEQHLTGSTADVLQQTLDALAELSGFERVLLYEFLPDGSGVVTAERYTGTGDRYLHLRYPATDIPQVARNLYLKTPYRYIHDAQSDPVPILSAPGESAESLDLTHAFLRSVSPFHIDYLNNMGIRGAMSFPLVRENSLAGMFSIHNPRPEFVPHATRMQMKAVADAFLRHQRATELNERVGFLHRYRPSVNAFCSAVLSEPDPDLMESQMDLMDAAGLVTQVGDDWTSYGQISSVPEIRQLVAQLSESRRMGTFSTDCVYSLGTQFSPIIERASGVLCVWFTHRPTGNRVSCVFVKPEVIQEVVWGSKVSSYPGEANPLNSFGQWREAMQMHSEPWSRQALLAAQAVLSCGLAMK